MRLRDLSPSAALLATLLAIPELSSAFYLPGVAPTSYKEGDLVPLNVNRLTPVGSQTDGTLRSVVSFDYYRPAFHFCRPEPKPEYVSESLGSILFGDRIMTSPFELKMAMNETCKVLCDEKKFDQSSAHFVNRRIAQGFALNWFVDRLPAGQLIEDEVTKTRFYSQGFALGSSDEKNMHLNNHHDILIDYHKVSDGQLRVVGVIVQPDSRLKQTNADGTPLDDCGLNGPPLILSEDAETAVQWTYSVYWRESPTAWATRWDKYLHVFDPKIHWFSLINSAIIVIFLTITVVSILFQALRKDIQRYNRLDSINLDDLSGTSAAIEDGVQEDSGWKLVHGDVFRTPSSPLILSVFLGNGAQLFVMTGFTIVFALLGFLSPSNRGSLGTIMILLYTVLGFIGGYTSARVYKSFGGEKWKLNIALTPLLVPGIVFSTFFLLNLFLWAKASSGAVPFTTMLVIVGIWFLISVPLSFAGSWVGFRQPPVMPPVHTNQIPRQIPPGTTYMRPIPSMLLVGILPFGAIFVELYFIMSSIWFSKVYYMFGFLFLCYVLMIITCAAVTVLMVYFLLCSENYHWQWRAFMTAGASAGYVFANALIYWVTKLQLGGLAGSVLYIGYSALISFLFFILTGTIGYFSSWAFVHKIYGSIKVD
ncbi:Endomembrane EMP70 [Hyphodiscus hymeniophilus]|uniref:Transmembrane 9 superfamily member n=1 Tax=Hyphodiscus hymeniophilus TaxID=353542 RepID=A0A9P6VKV5_9HELO|nr:Endomembrane EMP70 [Hyphodiscus hymeniophilus]